MPIVQQMIDAVFLSFAENPVALSLQIALGVAGCVAVYLLTYTVRDVLLRTRSLPAQLACILLVGGLPIAGFFLYLLVRPARTVKERQMERMLKSILAGEKKIAHTMADHGFSARVMDEAQRRKGGILQSTKKGKTHAVPASA